LGKRIICSYSVSSNKIVLSRDNLSQGYYFFEVYNEGLRLYIGQFLVQ
jgi:hypothetical protein